MARRKRKARPVPEGWELRYTLETGQNSSGEQTLVTGIEWHPDGDTIACLTEHEIWFGDHTTGVITETIPVEESLMSFAWSPDGDTIAVGTRENIILLDFHSADRLKILETGRPELTWHVAWSPNGLSLAALSHVVRIWDSESGQINQSFRIRRDQACCSAWSPDGDKIAWATNAVHIHSAETGALWKKLELDELQGAGSVAWSPDGQSLAIGCSHPRRVFLWNLESDEVVTLDSDESDPGNRVWFSPDGRLVAATYYDQIRIWSVADASLFAAVDAHMVFVGEPFAFHPTEPAIAVVAGSGADGSIVQVWGYDDSTIPGKPFSHSMKPATAGHMTAKQSTPLRKAAASPPTLSSTPTQFDVFLCHNSKDKPAVRNIAVQLKNCGLRPWLDEWQLRPGMPWQRALEEQIDSISAAVVFIGPGGMGPWQEMEQEAFLREFVNRRCPVIPVILPGVKSQPDLPRFLKGMTWVDFRLSSPNPLDRLVFGITGINPHA